MRGDPVSLDDYRRERRAYLRDTIRTLNFPPPPQEVRMSLLSNNTDIARYRVIKHSSLPMRCPLVSSIAYWLLLDRLHAPLIAFILVGAVLTFAWIAWIIGVAVNVSMDADGFGKITTKEL